MPSLRSTGWLTHWGEPMANTSATDMANTLSKILAWDNGFGSINLYMAHGGTNFGYWAGRSSPPVAVQLVECTPRAAAPMSCGVVSS